MRIAQICTNVMTGSVGSIVRNLYRGIENNGDKCLICFGRGKEPIEFDSYKFDSKLDIYWHVLMARIFDSDGLHSKKATNRLIKRLKIFNPDIVHIHCLHGYYINYPLLFKYFKDSNIKVVWTMHDCWAFTGHCANYDLYRCYKWKNGCFKCGQKKSFPKSQVFDLSKRNFKLKKEIFNSINKLYIITPSKWLKTELEHSFLKKTQSM